MDDKAGNTGNTKENGKNKLLVAVCIVAVVIIAFLLGVIVSMMGRTGAQQGEENIKGNETENDKRPVLITEDNISEIFSQAEPEEQKEVPLRYQVTMNSTWEFEDGKAVSSNAYVANSTNNETPVYFDVVRNDTEEVIYRSPVIPVGEHLDSVTLDTDLDVGSYECTLTYHLIDDDQNTLTTVNMWLMVNVRN